MKTLIPTCLLLMSSLITNAQNKTFSIGTNTPNANAALHIESPTNNQGLLIPRLTTAQRSAMTLATADKGLVLFDTDLNAFMTWGGAAWGISVYGSSATSAPAISGTSSGTGNAGYFISTNPANGFASVYAETNSTTNAGYFNSLSTSSTYPAVYAFNAGTAPAFWGKTDNGWATIYAQRDGATNGNAGNFEITSASNNYPALLGTTAGTGAAVQGVTGTGWATVFGKQTSDTDFKNAIVGQHDGTGKGHAGLFQITNAANSHPALQAETIGGGPAGYFVKNNTTVISAALAVETKSNVGGAAVNGYASGTASFGGAFEIMNSTNNYAALQARSQGTGVAAVVEINNVTNASSALFSTTNGIGTSIHGETATGWTAIYGKNTSATTGHAGFFEISNVANSSDVLKVTTKGTGKAGTFIVDNVSSGGNAIYATSNANSSFPTISVWATGIGSSGVSNLDGGAGTFMINNLSSTANSLNCFTNGSGAALNAAHGGAFGNIAVFSSFNVNTPVIQARIDKTGKGFFNGGTQNSGADVAEMFDVEGTRESYEPGDVLVISESTDRTVERSSEPNSAKVVGVYATKPGLTLTEKGSEENLDGLVPMGVIGVIPTKVCLENGPIKRGDLLATSSRKGHAMKAIAPRGDGMFPTGTVLGKALENFDSSEAGIIKVLVNVK